MVTSKWQFCDENIAIGAGKCQAIEAVVRKGANKDVEGKYADQIELLRSIPGIGMIGALTLVTEVGDMGRFSQFDQLCSYVGLVPNVYSSGEKEHVGNLTRRQNPYLLPVLLQCTWTAVGKDPALMKAYQDWCKVMKPNKAIIKACRKLLSRIRYVMIKKEKYQTHIK